MPIILTNYTNYINYTNYSISFLMNEILAELQCHGCYIQYSISSLEKTLEIKCLSKLSQCINNNYLFETGLV